MKKHFVRIAYILLVIGFLVLLANMNNLILLGIDPSEKFVRSEREYVGNTRVFLSLSSLETYSDSLESLSVSGWAFCETEGSNANKTYDIILQNDKDTYALQIPAIPRIDVASSFPDRNVASAQNGIECKASTIGVKDGIYHLCVYVWENEDTYGLIDTGRKLIKTKNRFEEYQFERITEGFNAQTSPLVKNSTTVSLENGLLQLSGWCFVEDQDTYDQQVWVMLLTEDGERAYAARKSARSDVASHFGNDDYWYSGYTVQIQDWEDACAYALCVRHGDEILRTDWKTSDLLYFTPEELFGD